MEYVLTTDDLSKHYKKGKALDGLCMHVPKGAIYGFVGKNGAGKTTLIRLICGLSHPTSGSFTLYGTEHTNSDMQQMRKRMGAVVETPALSSDMTAEENLRQQYRILGLSSFDGIKELIALVGLEQTGKKKVKAFSLGMKQRLGIAMAMAGEPDFLVLDEPTNGLDPQGIIELRELILKLNHEHGITFLISSHILDELARIATHYGIIDQGKMVKEFSADDLEKECNRKLHIKADVSDAKEVLRILEERGISYEIVSEKDKKLEEYFISLIGGDGHA
ncbi:MAG: ATP-binding cassette domain-containing protein [Lachnospiraceae bacterium]|nr:ATP-binding cassette domain-containing protein [Lachnospiraceae bacterium]